MKKFAVKLTHGDDVEILAICETKDEGLKLGADLRKQHSRDEGLMSLIEADFDENDQMIGTNYRLHEVI